MKQAVGYLLIGIGLVSVSIQYTLAHVCRYLEKISRSWSPPMVYLEELAFPIALSCICIIIGICLCVKFKDK